MWGSSVKNDELTERRQNWDDRMNQVAHKLNRLLERRFPERRVFLRSDTDTRFIRLTPSAQFVGFSGSALLVGWAIVATAIIAMDAVGSGSIREQAAREQALYETRINALAGERDTRANEAFQAQERFAAALKQVSQMQTALLKSEERRRELERGIEVVHATLSESMSRRAALETQVATLEGEIAGAADTTNRMASLDTYTTLDVLTEALTTTAAERDMLALAAQEAEKIAENLDLERRLLEEKNDRIFSQLEDAVAVSMEPLDKMFRNAGLQPDHILDTVRRGYSGQGGPLTPITFSTKGREPDPDSLRANGILNQMDRLNVYRIAAQKVPFGMPLKSSFRYTSGFGPRWGRMHEGTDFAAAYGTPIYATADGVVIKAGWSSGYGRLVKIQHEFGIETRYAHQAKILVKEGQRVSRGQQIGAMGNSGRSTGTHLHYEVRVGGKAVNPMTYIKAAKDVF